MDNYYKKMEMIMTRADLEEDVDTTIARFLAGLNKKIANRVDLQQYGDLE